jgi:hypothetical protein
MAGGGFCGGGGDVDMCYCGGFGGGSGGGAPRRDGDWSCPGCNALVFASKSECFKCHTPKPAAGGCGGAGAGYEG